MASIEPQPAPRSWKAGVAAPEQRRPGGPRWRREPVVLTTAGQKRARRLFTLTAGAGLALVAGLLLWVISWLSPLRPVAVLLIGAGYEENLAFPPNVYGMESLDDMTKVVQDQPRAPLGRPGLLRLPQGPRRLRLGDSWDEGLDKCRDRSIVLYLALHGATDRKGAYLLYDDADLRDVPENRLRLEQVLDRLAQLPAEQNKLLILDATQMAVNWPLGVLQNDFARELEKLGPRITAIPNLVVLSASGPGQRSWSSDEWRQTVFGHFVITGLSGAAPDDNHNGRISVWELYQYVRPSVANWVWANRQSWQLPVMLPEGDVGEERARAIELVIAPRQYRPLTPEVPQFQVPAELAAVWQRQQALGEQVPSPAVYTPELWRRYRALVMRYEKLVVAGATLPAGRIASQLGNLEQQIVAARVLDLASGQNSLAMPVAAGQPTTAPPAAVAQEFDRLWSLPTQDWSKQWATMQSGQTGTAISALRRQLLELLLDRAADDPTANLAKARSLALVLADPVSPLPDEIHYLVMLQRDLPTPRPPREVLRLALRSVALGNRAALDYEPGTYAYSESTYAWTRATVTTADGKRRRGQDLVFASEAASWGQANTAFTEAQSGYSSAQREDARVRDALAMRNRALADLPYLAHWVANSFRADAPPPAADRASPIGNVEQAWRRTHELAHALEAPPAPGATAPDLDRLTGAVRQEYEDLVTRFGRTCLTLTDVNLQIVWRDLDDVLVVPDISPNLRAQLLINRQRISRHLLLETGENAATRPAPDPKESTEQMKRAGRAQGQATLAVLGQSWFNTSREPGSENFTQAEHRLDTFAVEDRWWVSLNQVAEQAGHAWRQMPVAINRQMQQSQAADHENALHDLESAALLARAVDAADTLRLQGQPAVQARRIRVRGLLVWLADRTWEDHWFAQDPQAPPYYRTAGLLFIADARANDPRPNAVNADLRQLSDRISGPGTLVLAGQARLDVTSQQRIRVDYQVQPAAGATVPNGAPVVWAEPGQGIDLQVPPSGTRLVRYTGGDRASSLLRCELSSPAILAADAKPPVQPTVEGSSLRVRGLFRGQQIERDTRINLYLLPEVVQYQTPLPTRGDVAVRASPGILRQFGSGNGSVAIVLDCSGSMGPARGQAFGPTTKYAEALRALRQVLRRLPKGTTISIWVFGQAVGPQKTVANANTTVRRVQEPVVWDPEDAELLRTVMGKIDYPTLEPWNRSPIVRAMVSARADLRNAPGFKSILVLTDGMDNQFATDTELNPNKLSIPVFLTQVFRNSGIVVNMIGYKVVDEEQKTAEEQFKVIEKLPLPGKFVTVNDARQLADTLDIAIRQSLHYWVDTEENVPLPGPPGGVQVSAIGQNDRWYPDGLLPGTYKLRVHTDRRLTRNITIGRGDLLLVNLVNTDAGSVFERALYGPSAFPWKPALDRSGWRMTLLQNQSVGEGGLQMLMALEKTYNPREDTLQMLRPRQTWVEVRPPPDVAGGYAQRWGYVTGYPGPAWGMSVPRWPSPSGGPARPSLRVWWDPDQETPAATTLDRGADFQSPRDILDRPLVVDGDEVRVSSVDVEDHFVEIRPGVRESRTCLVVRVSHPTNRPVWARVRGLSPAGQEHHFYSEAAQYTGLFWPVTRDQADELLQSVSLMSLTTFKRNAERRGFLAEMRDLGTPDPADVRPRPALELE